jgi:UDP-GlcNAc3NAcA epimerase
MIHTGQHYDDNMSQVFFDELQIPRPQHHLNIHGGAHGEMTGRMLAGIESILLRERPACVIVYGDTNSTLAGALAAAKLHIPVAHVEAGLRSYNRAMPEEINRVVTDHLSTLLLCPTVEAVRNLRSEGVTQGVHHVGDVMYDAALYAADRASRGTLERLGLATKGYAVATIHRAENTDDPARLATLFDYLRGEARRYPIVMPIHPRTRKRMRQHGVACAHLLTTDPLGYGEMAALVQGASCVYTDSGGLQKEAYFHRVPCVTLREETEWTETIRAGWNRLWSVPEYLPRTAISDYGDGDAAGKIVEVLAAYPWRL